MLEFRILGDTDLKVLPISLGTVALGVDYGIEASRGDSMLGEAGAIILIRYAVANGVNLIDTAPNYGLAEDRIGLALKNHPDCILATKISIPMNGDQTVLSDNKLRDSIHSSLESSRECLGVDTLELVQIHNATVELIESIKFTQYMVEAQESGIVRHIGVSVYGEDAAIAAIESGIYKTVQIAYNLIDRTMERNVLPLALEKGVGVIVRSAFLKGALSEKVLDLPSELEKLKSNVVNLKKNLQLTWDQVPELAIRFCLSHPAVSTVLVGARSTSELQQAINAAKLGPLDDEEIQMLRRYSLDDERLTNPVYWSIA